MPWPQIVTAAAVTALLLDVMVTVARVGRAEILTGPNAAWVVLVKILLIGALLYLTAQAT